MIICIHSFYIARDSQFTYMQFICNGEPKLGLLEADDPNAPVSIFFNSGGGLVLLATVTISAHRLQCVYHTYIYIYTRMYMYIYIYIRELQRKRARERSVLNVFLTYTLKIRICLQFIKCISNHFYIHAWHTYIFCFNNSYDTNHIKSPWNFPARFTVAWQFWMSWQTSPLR